MEDEHLKAIIMSQFRSVATTLVATTSVPGKPSTFKGQEETLQDKVCFFG
jgi:hypothetical protein